ncbi:MAG: right-handed parallel beta-helix repeat-containing protein [Thermoplasmata archaeon]|nr:MAG: right-handed parallel beta-helix repeat-containing protein [Thermoplasmata archaeon]
MKGSKILGIFLFVMMMLSLLLFFQEEAEAGTVDYILLTDAPDGTKITGHNLIVGGEVKAYASGYNITAGYIDLVEVEWNESAGLGSFDNATGTSSTFTAESTGLTTITGENSSMMVSDDFDLNITSFGIDYIEITDTPDGTPLSGGVVLTGFIEWGYCSAYNISAGYLGIVKADWTAEGGTSTLLGGTPATSNGIDVGTTPVTVWLNATNSSFTDSVAYTVISPTIDYIDITDTPNGTSLAGGAVFMGHKEWGNCSAYNSTYGYIGLVSADWTAGGGSATLLGITPADSNGIDVGSTVASVWLNASYSGHTDSVKYMVDNWTVDYINITDTPNGTPLAGGTVPVGFFEWGYCSSYNDSVGYLRTVSANWIALGGNSALLGPTPEHTNGINVGTILGIVWFNASYDGNSDSVTYNVIPPTIDFIDITDIPGGNPLIDKTVPSDYQEWGNCSAYNNTAGFLYTVNGNWSAHGGSSTLIGPSEGHGSGIDVGNMLGLFVWFNASYFGHNASVEYFISGNYTIDYIMITDIPDGVPLTGGNVPTGYQEWGHCSAYNTTIGYLGTVSAGWTAEGGSATLLGPTPETTNGIDVGNFLVTVWLNASFGGRFYSVEYNVINYTVNYINITDVPDGTPLAGGTVPVGYQEWGYCSAYNDTLGYIGTVNADWLAIGGDSSLLGPTPAITNGIDVGTIACYVWFNASYMGHIAGVMYTVVSPTIDYIDITDDPDGTPLVDRLVPQGHIEWGYSSAYNDTFGYIETVSANWTAEGGSAYLMSPTPGVMNIINVNNTPGLVWFNASYLGYFDSVQYNVSIYTIDSINITDIPGGIPLIDRTVQPGYQEWGYCSAYNNSAGFIFTVKANWSAEGGTSTLIGPSEGYGSGIDVGTTTSCFVWFNASYYGHFDSVQYQVEGNGTVDYIIITDTPDGTPLSGGTVPTGYQEWGYCSAYNSTVGYLGTVSADWTAGGSSATLLGPTPATTNGIDVGGSPYTVWFNASYLGLTYSVQYVVIMNYTVDFIRIRDGPNDGGLIVGNKTYYIGQGDTFWAACYNNSFGYLGDYAVSWNSTNWSVGTVTSYGSSTSFQAVGVGTCVIGANYGGGISNTTGTITVMTYDVDHIWIMDAPNGSGSLVEDIVYKMGDSDVFYAAGYNNTHGYIGDVMVNWSSDDESVGTVTTPGLSTTFYAVGIGTCIVEADYGGGIINTTGTLRVAPVDYIIIRDARNGGGEEVENMFFYTWYGNVSFYAAAYNYTHGCLGDTNVTWASNDTNVGTVTTPGSSTYFDPVGDGTCIVTAIYNATISDNTGILTVSSYTVDYIQIRDAPGGLGNVVIDPEYKKGSVDIYYGALYSNIVGYLGDVPTRTNWSSSNPYVVTVTSPGDSTTVTCNDTNSGTSTITLWAMGCSNTTLVTVLNWTIDYISIRDAPGDSGNVIGDKTYCVWETDVYYVVAFNYTTGYVKDVIAVWECSNITLGTVTSPGSSTVFTAKWVSSDGMCFVRATYDIYINTTGFLTVLAPRTDYIQIRSADGGAGGEISTISYHKGDNDIFYGASYNSTVDYKGSVSLTSIWISSNYSIVDVTSPGNYSIIVCNETNGGTVTVTLTDGIHSYITTVTVLNWTVDYILIRDAPDGGGKDLTKPVNYPRYPVGHQTTFYGAIYNYTADYIGDVASISTWVSNNTDVVVVTSPGYYSTVTCSNTEYGIVKITLEDTMSNIASTQIIVLPPTIDYIVIRDAANGLGNAVENVEYDIGDTDKFYAAAYNTTAQYLRDVSVAWESDDTDVGTVTTPGSQTTFTAVGLGTCVVTAKYGGGVISDTTGILTVTLPNNITVDDSGGALFTSIQEAIMNAEDGDTIYVYKGIYHEHLTITKSITLLGEDPDETIIDGDGYGKVIFVTGDNVSISGFTIQDGEYGIYLQETDSTQITHDNSTHNIIQDYDYGIYCYRTTNAYIANNIITDGKYGIVTFHAHNDAIRYNTISYNTEFGAKDYNSTLSNCFNWNYFYKNKIAYWYDPVPGFPILEFDGNILEENQIAIMVENSSSISITNNTASKNDYGIYLKNASPNIADNTISDSEYGIYGEYSSPTISNNVISNSLQYGIYAKSGDSLRIINNTMVDSEMIFIDSTIKELWLKDSSITKVNTTVEDSHLDSTSSLEVQWLLRVRVVDEEGNPVAGAAIFVYDVNDDLIHTDITGKDGWTEGIPVIQTSQTGTSVFDHNPYRVLIVKDTLSSTQEITIESDTDLVVALLAKEPVVKPTGPEFPWALIFLIGFIGAFGLAAISLEVMKYGLISLFIPLYSRIKKENLLDQPTRERIYGYIIGNPGAHFGLIRDDLGLGSGQLVYHIKHLEEAHMIYSREDGIKKRFYPADIPKPKGGIPTLSDIQEKILRIIEENSGIVQKRIASMMGISRQVAGYHLTKIEKKGLISREVVGRETRYYALARYSV